MGQGWLLLWKGAEHFNENLYYLTGLDAFHTFALISLETDKEYVAANPIEYPHLKTSCDIQDVRSVSSGELARHLIRLLSEHKVSTLYCDYALNSRTPISPELIDLLRGTFPGLTFKPLPSQLLRMRMIKEPSEVAIIKKGIGIIKTIFEELHELIKPGVLESQIAGEIYRNLVKNGFNIFYDIFVASGSNSAIPYYRQNRDRLPDQSLVLIDICAALDYYVCDFTRTFPTSARFAHEQESLYAIIKEVQQEVLRNAHVGTTLAILSEIAKEGFARHGLGNYYLNKIGHFVGLAPDDPGNKDTPLEKGMVMTIEPGLYIPEERLGLRIEDTVIIQ